MELVAYLRVSTGRQAEQGLGLDVQERAIRRWARRHGHKIALVSVDRGVSGTLAEREGLTRALRVIRDGEARGLIVYRLDRLARDLVLQEQLLAEARRHGGHVFSTSEGETHFLDDDPDDPSRKLIRQVLGAVSEFDRAMIALRLRNGRRAKADRGGFAYGSPPYGTRAKKGHLAPEQEEREAVERMVELRRQGLTLRAIAATLDVEKKRPRRAGHWSPETVRRILRREGVRSPRGRSHR